MTTYAAVQFLPRPIFHGIGATPQSARRDATSNGATGRLEIVTITTRLHDEIVLNGGDLRPEHVIKTGSIYDLASY